MNTYFSPQLLLYLIRFFGIFAVFYGSFLLVIGLSSPENMYSAFVAEYLNVISFLRHTILTSADFLLHLASIQTERVDSQSLGIVGGGSVRMVYSCVGYGVMSFWAAFVLANNSSLKQKVSWLTGGWVVLWCLNVMRVALLTVAIQDKSHLKLQLDHHTVFNIVSYLAIFGMIYLYGRMQKQNGYAASL